MSHAQYAVGTELRPSHETIVDMILTATNEEMVFVASYLKRTIIPANHDQIIEAWNQHCKQMCWHGEDLGVPASLLAQKEAAEAKAAQQNQQLGIELRELQEAMEVCLSLSHNHHLSGSMLPWHRRLRDRLENLHQLLSRALGK